MSKVQQEAHWSLDGNTFQWQAQLHNRPQTAAGWSETGRFVEEMQVNIMQSYKGGLNMASAENRMYSAGCRRRIMFPQDQKPAL